MDEHLILELFLIYAAAKLVGGIFERLRQPAVVGELLAGVLLGPHLLGWIHVGEGQAALAEIGVIVLLFTVGLETRLTEFRSVAGPATQVGLLGIAIPFAAGWGVMRLLGFGQLEALFVGAALVATSVGVTARVLSDMDRLWRPEARVVLGAAVLDDVLGLAILAVVAGLGETGLSVARVAFVVGEAVAFVAVLALFGPRLARSHGRRLLEGPPDPRSPFILALGLCLGLSALAESIGLAALVGAFLAGLILAETDEEEELRRDMTPVADFVVPFFFVVTGARVDLEVFTDSTILGVTALITVVAVLGKVLGGVIGARSMGRRESLAVGVGMVPRGEVGILVASLGLSLGVVKADVYGAVIGMSVLTTVLAPPFLRPLFAEGGRDPEAGPPEVR
ncbi:MAG: cation:proton antiporter [Actinobacteria bacterium]|nr:cation:proton antiporter [Actinomycetota bacterium]